MNKKITLTILAALAGISGAAHSQLVISGVFDGSLSGGLPKGVELFVTADIADLSTFGIGSANNGGGSDGEEFSFTGSATEGDFIYVASESTGFNDFFGFAPTFTSGSMAINGDDAIELFSGGSVIDVFGDINVDGNGEPWEYLDGWAYRKDNIAASGSTFNVGDWTFSGVNGLEGGTNNATANTPMPIGSYAVPEPSSFALLAGVFALASVMYRRRGA